MRSLVIGLDGVGWDITRRFIDMGIWNNIGKLAREGIATSLISTMPPITAAAWASLATGRNPGKTGVYEFLSRNAPEHLLRPISWNNLVGKSFWDYLNDNGNRVLIFNYPTLYPPYPINGVIVGGWNPVLEPKPKQIFTFPSELSKELHSLTGGYRVKVDYKIEKKGDIPLLLENVKSIIAKQRSALLYLIKKENWDLVVSVFSWTDWILHRAWDVLFGNNTKDDFPQLRQDVHEVLRMTDELVGKLLETANDETNVFIVSDHGFGPQMGCFNLARWLETKGYLKRISETPLDKVSSLLDEVLFRLGKTRRVRYHINLEKSDAFVLGHTLLFGGIYLNKSADKLQLKEQIIRDMKKIPEDVGYDLRIKVFSSEELYKGPYQSYAPDLILFINEGGCIILKDLSNPIYKHVPYSTRRPGIHRMEGLLIACGPDIKRGEISGPKSIFDIAPTLLHLYRSAIPSDMDGIILKDIFKDDCDAKKANPEFFEDGKKIELTDQKEDYKEERKIRERLKEMGYF